MSKCCESGQFNCRLEKTESGIKLRIESKDPKKAEALKVLFDDSCCESGESKECC